MAVGASRWWWAALGVLVTAAVLALHAQGAAATQGGAVCHCQCCAQLTGGCTDTAATSFEVGDCQHCTREACWNHFRQCKESVVIESSCLAVKPGLTLAVIVSLLCGIAVLLVLSILRYHMPFIRRLFRLV